MLLDKIKNEFTEYTQEKCCDNGICAKFDKSVQNYVSLKIDSFFQKKHKVNTPKGIDCFVVVECREAEYNLYLLELKNQKQPNLLNEQTDVIEKFQSTIKYFLSSTAFKSSFEYLIEKKFKIEFLLISQERLNSTNMRDKVLLLKAYNKVLTKVFSIELPNSKGTIIQKSIEMKPHSEVIVKCS